MGASAQRRARETDAPHDDLLIARDADATLDDRARRTYADAMDVPLACVAGAFLLIYGPRLVVFRAQAKLGYDNRDPRGQQSKLEGAARRAQAAHNNSFEAFAPFAAAVLACEIRGADAKWTEILALAFVALRVLYVLAYVGDKPTTRSTVWTVGFGCVVALFALAVFK